MIHPGRRNPNQGSGSFRSGRALPCPPLSWNPCASQLPGCFSVLASGLAFINKHSLAQNAPPPPGLQMSVEVFMNRYTLPHPIPSPGLLCSCTFPVSLRAGRQALSGGQPGCHFSVCPFRTACPAGSLLMDTAFCVPLRTLAIAYFKLSLYWCF